MIWFYLAGFISGVVGMLLLGKHLSEKEGKKDGVYRQGKDR